MYVSLEFSREPSGRVGGGAWWGGRGARLSSAVRVMGR